MSCKVFGVTCFGCANTSNCRCSINYALCSKIKCSISVYLGFNIILTEIVSLKAFYHNKGILFIQGQTEYMCQILTRPQPC